MNKLPAAVVYWIPMESAIIIAAQGGDRKAFGSLVSL
jgi:hypothetical protein